MGSEWQEAKLTDLYEVSSGLSKAAKYFGSGFPFLAFKEVFNNFFIPDQLSQLVQSSEQEQQKCSVKRGDVFLTRTSETMDELGMSTVALKDYDRATFNGFTKRLRPKENNSLVPEYVGYYLRSPKFRREMLAFSTMSTRASLNNEMISRLSITFPSVEIQNVIGGILRTLDDKITLNHQINTTLESMAQALFKSWFVDFDPVIDNALAAGNPIPEPLQARADARAALGDQRKPLPDHIRQQFPDRFVETEEMGWVPEGWEPTVFGRVSECFDKKRIPLSKKQRQEKSPGTIPYYGATSVMDYVDEWIFNDIYLLVGEDGSVIKEDGTPFTQYIWGKAWVNNHAHVLQGKGDICTEHLLLFAQQQNVGPFVTGAVQPKINQKNLNRMPFLKATSEINQIFSQRIKPIFDKVRAVREEIQTLGSLRDTLLPKLLSGELRIQEAEKEVEEVI